MRPTPAILDVGCGEGVLNELLRQGNYASYTGIDVSHTAISRAAARLGDERTRFVAADADSFESDEAFDIVVFNETLYYFSDPAATLHRLGGLLQADGVFVISMALGGLRDRLLKMRIWQDVARAHETLDEVSLHGPNGPVRIIKVLRRR